MAAGNISNGNKNSSARFQETYKRTRYRDPLPVPTFANVSYASNNHSGEGVFQKTCIRDGPVVMPLLTVLANQHSFSELLYLESGGIVVNSVVRSNPMERLDGISEGVVIKHK
ncbi:hypothetical protein ACOSP7_011337 [Xanthoceras sorbifolium]